MRYISTRGQAPTLDFTDVTLAGLASDGGLYVPEQLPVLAADQLRALAGCDYVETAHAVMRPFVAETIDDSTLNDLLTRAYSGFSHKAIAPLRQLDQQHWLLELFHGPTLAFKDFALQLLGLLFEHLLAGRERHLTIVGATSGDTGSAAIHALAGRDQLDVVMLHPLGRVSDVQRRQMTTVMAPNIYNIAIEGTFDDCQALVKAMFNDAPFRERHQLSAVNSINWTRLLVQIVYYVYAAVRLGAPDRQIAFSVPTGNFGDVFAGYLARRMGVPIDRLVVATNVNDILYRALLDGDYSVGEVSPTMSPSMDIQISSNFERLLFDLNGRDGARLAAAMAGFEASRQLRLDSEARLAAGNLFVPVRIDEAETARTLARAWSETGQMIDPHTAVGLAAAWRQEWPKAMPVVTLATAHPAKFRDPVERATGMRPSLPARLGDLMGRAERYEVLPNDLAAVQAFVADKVRR